MKTKAIYSTFRGKTLIEQVYSSQTRALLEEKLDFSFPFYKKDDPAEHKDEWKNVEFIFSTWEIPELDEEEIKNYFPALKAVFYAAGSVQYFAKPFLKNAIRVITANEALSLPVVDFTCAQIFLANKGFFQTQNLYHKGRWIEAKNFADKVPGNEGITAGIIGAGRIGKGVIKKLKEGRLKLMVFDPFLDKKEADELGVKKAENLEELFCSCYIISNHLANNEKTKGMLQYRHFSLMHDYGVFINTGRGAQVDEAGLAKAFSEKPGRTALLDVSWPEPVEQGHPFYNMENIILSPHIAGTMNNEHIWLGEYIAEEFISLEGGGKLRGEVTEEMLAIMA